MSERAPAARLIEEMKRTPWVVGTIITEEFAHNLAEHPEFKCDAIEFRLDGFSNYPGWMEAGQSFTQRTGKPVFATLRLSKEGGNWSKADRERIPLLEKAIEGLAGVDVELESEIAEEIGSMARSRGKLCVVSHHNFQQTPSQAEMIHILERAQEIGNVIKIAATANSPQDAATLRSLLELEWKTPICVIGMGPFGRETRYQFPKLGSCMTYGYLDVAGAPGQFSAAELWEKLGRDQSRARAL